MQLPRVALSFAAAIGLAGCCGDTSAQLLVHVVDGENGALVAQPTVEVEGDELLCSDGRPFDVPVPTDDAGTIPPPGGTDLGVGPPPTRHWCETWSGSFDAGLRVVTVRATGYLPTEAQVDLGSGGSSLGCPDPRDAEVTIALYRRP